jgi:hypothetical protein
MARLLADQPKQQHAQVAGAEEAATAVAEAMPSSAAGAIEEAAVVPPAPWAMLAFAQPDIIRLAGETVPGPMMAAEFAMHRVLVLVPAMPT